MGLPADDCVLEMPRGDRPWGTCFEGTATVREGWAGRFENLPDVHHGNSVHFADAETESYISTWSGSAMIDQLIVRGV